MKKNDPHKKPVAMQRAGNRQWVLKPQDLAVAFKLISLNGERLPFAALGEAMHLSQYEAHAAVQRLVASRLFVEIDGQLRAQRSVFRDFVIYGAPYCFPPVQVGLSRGFPTAHSAAPLRDELVQGDEPPVVWPHPQGKSRGMGLLPLYQKLPLAAEEDPALYEYLTLFDALRVGRARERGMAQKIFKSQLK